MSVYLPSHFQVTDRALLLEFMAKHAFVQLIGHGVDGFPFVSHLPLAVRDEGSCGVLEGHFALGNPQVQDFARKPQALVVFTGPHSYVSPTLYASSPAVPTWNYTAVHGSGAVTLIDDAEEKERLLKGLIAVHEPAYAETWRGLDEAYRQRMLKGIVGFRIVLEKLEGNFKLNQNRQPADRQRVYQAHGDGDENQRQLAAWMERLELVG